jgi:hypothetical protein
MRKSNYTPIGEEFPSSHTSRVYYSPVHQVQLKFTDYQADSTKNSFLMRPVILVYKAMKIDCFYLAHYQYIIRTIAEVRI